MINQIQNDISVKYSVMNSLYESGWGLMGYTKSVVRDELYKVNNPNDPNSNEYFNMFLSTFNNHMHVRAELDASGAYIRGKRYTVNQSYFVKKSIISFQK